MQATRTVFYTRKAAGGERRRHELGHSSSSVACTEASQVLSNPGESRVDYTRVSEHGKEGFLEDLNNIKNGSTLIFWTNQDVKSNSNNNNNGSEDVRRAFQSASSFPPPPPPPLPTHSKQPFIPAPSPSPNITTIHKPLSSPVTLPGRKGKPLCYSARSNAHDGLPPLARHCIDYLKMYGLQTEGILRISGTDAGMNEVKKYIEEHPGNGPLSLTEVKDVSVPNVAGALKRYFRNLAEPVVPFDFYSTFLAIDDPSKDFAQKCRALRIAIRQLPKVNQIALREICGLGKAISDQHDINLMTSSNCATILVPSLLEYPMPPGLSSAEMANTMTHEVARLTRVTQVLIDGYKEIFDRLVEIEANSNASIKKVNAVLRGRIVLKGENNSSLPKALFENFQEETLPAVFGCLVPKLGDSLLQWAPPKLRTFEELRKAPNETNDDLKMIVEAGEKVKMHNLRVEVNDVSLFADSIKSSGLSRALPELDEMFGLAGKAIVMLANWVICESQLIFRRLFFSQEWFASKFNTTVTGIEQLQRLVEENVRPMKSEGHRGVLLDHITRGLLGQYCCVFASKANYLRTNKVINNSNEEQQLKFKLRLKEDEELMVNMFGDLLRLAQTHTRELMSEVMSCLNAINTIFFSSDMKELALAVKTTVKYIGVSDAYAALSDLLSLRKDRKYEEVLPAKINEKTKEKEKDKDKNNNNNNNNNNSRWVLDMQVKSVILFDPLDNTTNNNSNNNNNNSVSGSSSNSNNNKKGSKKCDVNIFFRQGTSTVATTTLKDIWSLTQQQQQQYLCTSVQKQFETIMFEIKLGSFLSYKSIGVGYLDTEKIRQELILHSNFCLVEKKEMLANIPTNNFKEEEKVVDLVSSVGLSGLMAKFKETNRQSLSESLSLSRADSEEAANGGAGGTLLSSGYFKVALELYQDSQVTGVLTLALRYTRDPWMDMSQALKDIGTEDHDTLWELNGDPRAEDLKDCVFRLQDIPDRWHLGVEQYMDKDHKDQEIANGLMSMLAALKDIYYMPDPRWHRIRDRIEVGVVKATRNCGNTSVSMGLAEAYLSQELMKPNGHRTVAFLNCGTGGVKMQMYACKGGPVFAMMEAKPRKCSISVIQIGGYIPKKKLLDAQGEEFPIKADVFCSMLDKELTKAPWNRSELQVPMRKFLNNYNDQRPEVFAFVTGSIRGYWENKDLGNEEKKNLESVVAQIFRDRAKPASSILHSDSKSYFIQQEDEGAMELLAVQSMYKAIGSIGVAQFSGMEVLASLGIGTGSSQWTEQNDTVSINHGMISQHLLSNLGRTIVKNYQDPVKFDNFMTSLEQAGRPTIALKSGCLLQLYDKKVGDALRARLCFGDPVVEEEEESRSLARVCAEAGAALKASEHFLKAEIRGGRIVFLSPYPGDASFPDYVTEGKPEEWTENPMFSPRA